MRTGVRNEMFFRDTSPWADVQQARQREEGFSYDAFFVDQRQRHGGAAAEY